MARRSFSSLKKAIGFSLIEILIASTLGLILLGAFFHLYLIDIKGTYQLQSRVVRNDTLRFLHFSLGQLVKKAGDLSWCEDRPQKVSNAQPLPASLIAYPQSERNHLPASLRESMKSAQGTVLFVASLSNEAKGDQLLLSDCDSASAHLNHYALYLGEGKETGTVGVKKSIFLKNLMSLRPAEALAVGVDDFEMTFAERVGEASVWREAESISDWREVRGVKFLITLPVLPPAEEAQKVSYIFAKRYFEK